MQQLKKHFSPWVLLLISINGMIGSAWLFGPFYAAKSAGPASLFAWGLGAAAVVLIAFTFAELSVLFPVAGGVARIPQLTHGTTTSFVMGWIAWLSCVTMPPIEVQAVLRYASVYFPSLSYSAEGHYNLTALGMLWAVLLMAVISWINMIDLRKLIKTNFIMTLIKVGIIIVLGVVLLLTHFDIDNFSMAAHLHNGNDVGSIGWHGILVAISTGGVIFAFTGFRHGVELAAEAQRPRIAIPLAIVGSVLFCFLLYFLLQVAFIGALTPDSLSQGWQGLHFSSEAGPFVGLAGLLGLSWLVSLIYLNATVSPLGAALVYVTSTSRIVYAMSKNRYFPKLFLKLTSKGIPLWAIVLNFFVGLLLFLPFPGWQGMISFLVSAVVISYGMGSISLLSLRYQAPQRVREFRLPCATPLCLLAFYICNLIVFWSGWYTVKSLVIAIIIGLLIFFMMKNKVKQAQSLDLYSACWLVPYLIGMTVISYLGTFGGIKFLAFGWDFLVIALFSVIIFCLAILTRHHHLNENLLRDFHHEAGTES
ncbi:L-aspartate transporter [Piscirickettsia salmonis]|uniref:APC family permease n=1 Tax=Piscirickettsia salmonis TaxID=1238 RepID=UPI0012B75016|nr:APC family permease [Piscirickettsia salmonis]QGP49042.1 L-aspartate transporter [Piscirickettsia salmonis]QGP57925.1 L-aspartate transporter [Piscirickettsia salmonis]QGP65767.1 L-aspartate transporter [Piscirickettsia salmonis]